MSGCIQPMHMQVARETAERNSHRPPKRNNVKLHFKKSTAVKNDDRCEFCGCNEFDADGAGFNACTNCGRVHSASGRQFSHSVYDYSRTSQRKKPNTRCNYFNERLSQWQCQEPAIPSHDRESLVVTYNGGLGPYHPEDGALYYPDPVLCKDTVRQIIIDAGLAPKVYLEKWLTIRIMLGAEPHPMPDHELVQFMRERFWHLERCWRQNADMHPRRKSLPNYNFIIRQLLLLHSAEAYETHYCWFPVSVEAERGLMEDWVECCHMTRWPVYFASWDADGRCHRMREHFIAKGKRKRPRPQPTRKPAPVQKTKITQWFTHQA